MAYPRSVLLADVVATRLSPNALGHLRRARVAREPSLSTAPEALRAQLLLGGYPAPDAVVRLEGRVGGTVLPGGTVLGTGCLLRAAAEWLRPRHLPRLAGELLLPVFADPERLAFEWEEPVLVMGESGALALFDAPAPPLPAYVSLEHLLEVEALAPLGPGLHVLRVDAHCGPLLAGLVGALPHPPAGGERTAGFVGNGVWVKELRLEPFEGGPFSCLSGTFLLTEDLDLVVESALVLLAEGYGLGHRGPAGEPPPGAAKVLSFIDASPVRGRAARQEVAFWGAPGCRVATRTPLPGR